jgi:hypothetical protein
MRLFVNAKIRLTCLPARLQVCGKKRFICQSEFISDSFSTPTEF